MISSMSELRKRRCAKAGAAFVVPRGAEDPIWQGTPFVHLSGSGTAYIDLFATVHWDRCSLHLTRQDWKTGAADATWDLPIDEATLEQLRSLPWPEPGEGPWF